MDGLMPLSPRTKIILALRELRLMFPNIKVSEAEVLFRIAANEGVCQHELIDVMKPSSVGTRTVMNRTFLTFAAGGPDGPLIQMHQKRGERGFPAKETFLTAVGQNFVSRIERILER